MATPQMPDSDFAALPVGPTGLGSGVLPGDAHRLLQWGAAPEGDLQGGERRSHDVWLGWSTSMYLDSCSACARIRDVSVQAR